MSARVTDSGDIGEQIRGKLGPRAERVPASIDSIDSAGNVTVLVGGNVQSAFTLPALPLAAGDNVTVLRQGGVYTVIGPTVPLALPSTGTVSATPSDSTTITVTTTIGDLTCGWLATYTPTIADVVQLIWLGTTPFVLGLPGVNGIPPTPGPPIPVPPPVPAPPKILTGTWQSFTASDDGTYRGGEWLSTSISIGNVMAGDFGFGLNDGAWFYGGRVHSSLAGATVTAARIYLARVSGGTSAAQAVHLFRVTNNTQPSGDLTFDGANTHDVSLAVGQSGWFTLPVAFAQALVDSGGSVGIKAPSGPYVRLAGLANKPNAGQLQISWKRSA